MEPSCPDPAPVEGVAIGDGLCQLVREIGADMAPGPVEPAPIAVAEDMNLFQALKVCHAVQGGLDQARGDDGR